MLEITCGAEYRLVDDITYITTNGVVGCIAINLGSL